MKPRSSSPTRRLFALLSVSMAVVFGLLAPMIEAGTHSADSNATAVDTRDNLMTVSGRVRDAQTGTAITGATVSLAGQNRPRRATGRFRWRTSRWRMGTLAASKTGATYATRWPRQPGPRR